MKTVLIFLLGVIVAVGGIYLRHKFGTQESKTAYVLDLNVSNGQRVLLKDGVTVDQFENQLIKVDPNDADGTDVNIKPERDNPAEVQGPSADNKFPPANKPTGPDGSMHVTQKVAAHNMDDLQSVLSLLSSTGSTAAGKATSTSAPTVTPSPSP
jgi:hypothetical protein